jgi:hypothetical protein
VEATVVGQKKTDEVAPRQGPNGGILERHGRPGGLRQEGGGREPLARRETGEDSEGGQGESQIRELRPEGRAVCALSASRITGRATCQTHENEAEGRRQRICGYPNVGQELDCERKTRPNRPGPGVTRRRRSIEHAEYQEREPGPCLDPSDVAGTEVGE